MCYPKRGHGETDMNPGGVYSRTMKIVLYSMEPRLRASFRGTAGRGFFELFVPNPPRRRLFGGGGNHRKGRQVKKILVSYLNSSIFLGNAQLQENVQGGSTPAAVTPNNAITSPGQAIPHHPAAQGVWGTGTVPSFIVPAFCFS